MKVSFIVVIRNAAKSLPNLLLDIQAQDYPKESIEILLVDGRSTDKSMDMLQSFDRDNPLLNIKILDNPGKILSTGWNVALAAASGDVILRVDAHSRIPSDFISRNVATIDQGEKIVGGMRISVVPKATWSAFLALAEASKFGAGSAGFKNPGPARYVETLAHAAYRKEVFAVVGGYDERLVRNQDMEIHRRMKDAGFKFYFNPEIQSFHFPRSDLKGLLKQKFGNGFWIALTMSVSPKCFCIRHGVPFMFVLAVLGGVGLGVFISWIPLSILLGVYFLCAFLFAFKAMGEARKSVKVYCLMLPIVFFLIHVFYGFGTLAGALNTSFFLSRQRKYRRPYPIARIV